MIEANKEIEFGMGTYRLVQEDWCPGPDIYFTLPWVNGTELRLHYFLDTRGECQFGLIQWSIDHESDFFWLCDEAEYEKEYEIIYKDIDEMIEKLRPLADELLTDFILQGENRKCT
jgi:hypothetical protein